MRAPNLFSHVDLRVRQRDRAAVFYDKLLGAMGLARRPGEVEFVSYGRLADGSSAPQWFYGEDPFTAFFEDPDGNRLEIAYVEERPEDGGEPQ